MIIEQIMSYLAKTAIDFIIYIRWLYKNRNRAVWCAVAILMIDGQTALLCMLLMSYYFHDVSIDKSTFAIHNFK